MSEGQTNIISRSEGLREIEKDNPGSGQEDYLPNIRPSFMLMNESRRWSAVEFFFITH